MTQKNIKLFVDENYSKPRKKIYITNKTDVYHTDDICSLDILDLKDYGPGNNKIYRFVLIVIDNLSEVVCKISFKSENDETTKNSSEKTLTSSKKTKINRN